MKYQSKTNNMGSDRYELEPVGAGETVIASKKTEAYNNFFQHYRIHDLGNLLTKLMAPSGKKSFLVFKNNKYINVLTENIAFFYVNYESSIIKCFDKQEYFVNHSLDQIQSLLTENQFFRLNRQYLINFSAVKEVEHYFARKLLVNLAVPAKDKLLVSKEKVSVFLNWLDNR